MLGVAASCTSSGGVDVGVLTFIPWQAIDAGWVVEGD